MSKLSFDPLLHRKISAHFPQTLMNDTQLGGMVRPSDVQKVIYVLSREGKQCLCNLSVLTDLKMDQLNLIVDGLEELGIVKRSKIQEEEVTHQVEILNEKSRAFFGLFGKKY